MQINIMNTHVNSPMMMPSDILSRTYS